MNGKTAKWFWLAGVVGVAAILSVAVRYVSVFSTTLLADREAWGQFGDYFGGILNPLLSFAAFVTLLITLRSQMLATASADSRTEEQVREQRFFQLMGMVGQSAINSTYRSMYAHNANAKEGHAALHNVWMDFQKFGLPIYFEKETPALEKYKKVNEAFSAFETRSWPSIVVFVQSSFLILKFIAKSGRMEDEFVQFATEAFKSQLTESERLLLWYVALCMNPYKIYVPLLLAFKFSSPVGSEFGDPLEGYADELAQCALLTAPR